MRSLFITAAAALTLLAGCGGADLGTASGGSSSTGTTGTTGTGTGTGTTTYELGNGTGSSFKSGMIGLSSATVSAGGTTSLTLNVVNEDGVLYTAAPVIVSYSSTCIANGEAVIAASGTSTAGTAADTVTSSTGTIDATYTAKGCSGSDVITATATVGTTALTATGTVTVAPATVGSIQFESASPTTIGLKGTGLNDTSTVIFKVVDSSGSPRPNAVVKFSLTTTAGGLSVTPVSAISAADGTVKTVVSSGVEHTTVRVTASISSPALSAESSQLAVSTGLPTSKSFTLSLGPPTYPNGVGIVGATGCPNVEAYTLPETTVPVTATLSDRYGNPVPDGTTLAFQTDGGTVTQQCVTAGGACTVTWTSTNPVPSTTGSPPSAANGRALILATAIGEESFTDINGSGYYVSGDPFSNLGEPFLDVNESGAYVSGDPYYNFYNASAWEGPASPPVFKGIVCTGDTPTSTCTSTPLGIGRQQLLIMSGTYAKVTFAAQSGNTLAFNVTDENNNPMPAYSVIATSISPSTIGTLSGPGTAFTTSCGCFGGPSTYCPVGSGPSYPDDLYVTLAPTAASGTVGTVTVTVTAPGTKITSQAVASFTVH